MLKTYIVEYFRPYSTSFIHSLTEPIPTEEYLLRTGTVSGPVDISSVRKAHMVPGGKKIGKQKQIKQWLKRQILR